MNTEDLQARLKPLGIDISSFKILDIEHEGNSISVVLDIKETSSIIINKGCRQEIFFDFKLSLVHISDLPTE